MNIAWRGQVRNSSHFLKGMDVNGKDHMRVIHYYPTDAIADNHGLCHISQLHGVGTIEDFVLHLFSGGIIKRKSGIPVLEIPLVGDKKTFVRNVEVFVLPVIPFHTTSKQHPEGCCYQYHNVVYMDREFHTYIME